MVTGRKTGGRVRGTPNKDTIAKQRAAGLIAERTMMDARESGKKLAKDVLDDFMHLFAGMAAHYQPAPPDQMPNPNADPAEFYRTAELAIDCANKLAAYQSPTFKAIATVPPTPIPPTPKTIEGKVIRLDDPAVAGNIYRRLVQTVRGK